MKVDSASNQINRDKEPVESISNRHRKANRQSNPNPNPREEQRPARPTCRAAHTTAVHRSAGRRRQPPVRRQTAAVARNREPSRHRVEQRHARARAQGTAPRPFDGGTLSLGRAREPAKSPTAAQSPPPASHSGGRRSTRSGGKERRGGKEKGRWQWTAGRIWRCAGGAAAGSGRERSQMALGFERKNRPPTIWFLRSPRSAVGSQRTAAIHAGGGGSRGWADSAAQRAEWCSGLAGRAS